MKKFIVEFRLKAGDKNQVMSLFERQGPNRSPGVSFRDAWIGTKSEIIFVLCESTDEALVENACQAWREFGEGTIHSVIHHEQF